MLGTQDLLLGLVIAAFFFGAKRLPELASSLGKSMKEFKHAVAGGDETPQPQATPAPAQLTAAPARTCPACKSPMQADWTHCPRCGAAAQATATEPTPSRPA